MVFIQYVLVLLALGTCFFFIERIEAGRSRRGVRAVTILAFLVLSYVLLITQVRVSSRERVSDSMQLLLLTLLLVMEPVIVHHILTRSRRMISNYPAYILSFSVLSTAVLFVTLALLVGLSGGS